MKVAMPIVLSQVLWGISVPMQTAILGHLSGNAIAANSVATTFYQYLKVVVIAMSSTSAVMIGNAIGRGDMRRIRSDARTLAVIDGWDVLSDAGKLWHYSRCRRYKVHNDHEYGQYMGNCDAVIICGSILVEMAGRSGCDCNSVRSDF